MRIPGSGGSAGRTTFTIHATNPDQTSSGTCQVSTDTQYSGEIYNGALGCNVGGGTWSNSLSQSGSFNWSKNCLLPDGFPKETTYTSPAGWNDASGHGTAYMWQAQINASSDFAGRTVEESQVGTGTDSCHAGDSILDPYHLTGGGWYVGYSAYNYYGYDEVGWFPGAVQYYRGRGRAPCSASVTQSMSIFCNSIVFPKQSYISSPVTVTIGTTTVSSSRGGQTQTRSWITP